jgi:hypothetical protein
VAIEVMTWVWNHSQARHGARLVMLAIADYMNGGHSWAWPSMAALAEKTLLKERAIQVAIADLAKLGELEVDYNGGPKGCNRYRVLMSTPAESAPPQNLHPADNAPPQNLRGSESPQASTQDPAESAPPADNAPPQNLHHPPAESAPGTVIEPKTKISPTERSTARNGQQSLLPDSEIPPAEDNGKPKRGRRIRATGDPLFDKWYAAYPVHKARGDAETAWAKAMREGADPQVLTAAAARYRSDPQVARGYGKHPATWLNKKCWLDEDSPPPDPEAKPEGTPRSLAGKQLNYTDEEYRSGW